QRDAGDQRGGSIAQEHENNADHHADSQPHGELNVVERLANGFGAVAPHVELGGGGQLRVEYRDQLFDFIDHFDDVASRLAHHEETDGADRALGRVQPGNTSQILHAVDDG